MQVKQHSQVARFVLLAGSLVLAASAQARTTLYEEAIVLSSTPVYRVVETSTPSRECWNEEVVRQRNVRRDYDSATPNILGAVIGGAIGNAVGHKKRNKQVGTVVGAILGGSIARDIEHSNRRGGGEYIDVVQRCRTVHNVYQEERLIGYDVRYRYNGVEQVTRMDHDPGATMRVRVSVEPAE